MFIFRLQSTIPTIIAHDTEELEDNRRTSENVTQLEQEKEEAYRARLNKPLVTFETLYTSPFEQEGDGDAPMMYGK